MWTIKRKLNYSGNIFNIDKNNDDNYHSVQYFKSSNGRNIKYQNLWKKQNETYIIKQGWQHP